MLGLAIGAAMCYPGIQLSALSAGAEAVTTVLEGTLFQSPVYIDFFGIPVISVDYTGTVIPVILTVWFASKCEKLFNRFVPDLVKFFFVPMLTLLVTLPVAMIFLGPVATFGSTLISEFTLMIREFSPLLAGAVVGFTWQILVIFGMHWGFIPVYINNVQTLGYDNVMMPFFACTFATSAVVLAMFFKTKDKKIKEMAIPNFISGIFGVTEPAIYGMLLPLKKPFIISCIAGGIGGAFYGHFNFRKFILGGMGIFELPNMINPDGTNGNIIVAFIGIAISMVVGFVLTMIFYHDEKTGKTGEIDMKKNREKEDKIGKIEKFDKNESDKIDRKERKTEKISSPLKGEVIALSDVQDEAFSSGALGLGAAVDPKEGVLYAPADGTISVFFPTGHAIGMTTDDGVELLIHVGMDTVQLEGKGFRPFAKEGDRVTKGQKLLEFDMELICKEGYSLVTPVLITNTDEFFECAKNPDLRFIVSNTTEAGIEYKPNQNPDDFNGLTFPGRLTLFMKKRFDEGLKGFILLPCELIDKNGDNLKECILKYSEDWGYGSEFEKWIETENHFTNTLVDRIVTGYPRDNAKEMEQSYGYLDDMIDTAEIFHLWVIEGDKKLAEEIPFHKIGLNVLWTDDVTPYKKRKVRILNGAHTMTVLAAHLAGLETVKDAMDDELVFSFMKQGIFEEIIPTLDLPKNELEQFANDVIERFKNPFIKHYLLSIALNSVSKYKVRVLPSVLEYIKEKNCEPKRLVFSLAALIAFYRTDAANDDKAVMEFMKTASAEDILKKTEYWGEDLSFLLPTVQKHLDEIEKNGIRKAMEKVVD